MRRLLAAALAGCALPLLAFGAETAVTPTSTLYLQNCAMCHEGGVPRAPHSVQFGYMGPQAILNALENGVMQAQGSKLTPAERRELAEQLGGAKLPSAKAAAAMPMCKGKRAEFDLDQPPAASAWGETLDNARFINNERAGLASADVPKLELKWAFGLPGASRARSQPSAAGGALFFGSQDGTVYAIDLETACVRWRFQAETEVRTSPVVEPWPAGAKRAEPKLYFGDMHGNMYALEAFTGKQVWRMHTDPHPRITITGSPQLHEGRLYVPLSSSEWLAAADPAYECCTFRGGVAAIDARDGTLLWRSYSIVDEPRPIPPAKAGETLRHAPAGAPVWNSPTIDAKRGRLYVGTGEAYTSPAANTSDAVLAFDLATGKLLWHYQSIAADAWNMACFIGGGPNCPTENGPDTDIGAATILARLPDGRDALLVGQKSGHVFALNPDTGVPLWRAKYGRGGVSGGVHWGMSYDGRTLFVPMTDIGLTGLEEGEAKPGLFALNPATGQLRWYERNKDVCAPETKPGCDPGVSPPATSMPGIVFTGAYDGRLRAHDSATGKVVWEFNTLREFDTVNGVHARGGAIESAGPVVINGHLVTNSGYSFGGRLGGNVLLAFTVGGK